jgi:hypothetical protein
VRGAVFGLEELLQIAAPALQHQAPHPHSHERGSGRRRDAIPRAIRRGRSEGRSGSADKIRPTSDPNFRKNVTFPSRTVLSATPIPKFPALVLSMSVIGRAKCGEGKCFQFSRSSICVAVLPSNFTTCLLMRLLRVLNLLSVPLPQLTQLMNSGVVIW